MIGKALIEGIKTTIKSQITNMLDFYPLIHLIWHQKISSTILIYRNKGLKQYLYKKSFCKDYIIS